MASGVRMGPVDMSGADHVDGLQPGTRAVQTARAAEVGGKDWRHGQTCNIYGMGGVEGGRRGKDAWGTSAMGDGLQGMGQGCRTEHYSRGLEDHTASVGSRYSTGMECRISITARLASSCSVRLVISQAVACLATVAMIGGFVASYMTVSPC
jgi:hypothetical protein